MRTIVLDNEPSQALLRPTHPKHRIVMAHLAGVAVRRRKGSDVMVVVPTSVRAEAGWVRRALRSAIANRLRVKDVALDASAADIAADVVSRTGVSVADAHVGTAALTTPDGNEVVVLTSDPADIRNASAPRSITVVAI